MFKKILIANRGEIAVRIIRTCREMGIRTVLAHSEADRDSLPVSMADEAVCIGPGPATESYLNIPNIISAAEITGADAIHPGYGFLAENTYFAEVCESCGLSFIGPSRDAIRAMGDKAQARRTMEKAGVPIIPGSNGTLPESPGEIAALGRKVGFPLIVKATAGGGGKGMRIVQTEEALPQAITIASAEALSAFGNGGIYLERYLAEPRHIEFQIVADARGHVLALPERDCSVQRRHQKLLEESPSPAVDAKLRKKMAKAAVKAAKAVGYSTVGTIEFMLDQGDKFYFIEMNTRIQVEHPVTEMVTGLDLIREQIRLAAGEPLGYDEDDIELRGHAIECRVNAEDPDRDFAPSPGTVAAFVPPGGPGVRVDTHVFPGYPIPPFYDSLLAKLIVWHETREACVGRMNRALAEFRVEGVKTTIPFHRRVMNNPHFQSGEDVSTSFIQKHLTEGDRA